MKRLPGKILLVFLGIAAALLIAEAGLRIAGFQRPFFYVYDDTRGWALRPGYQGWQTDEGRAFLSINDDGFRDTAHSTEKPAGTFRIAVIGDSYAEAYQVPLEKTFLAVMKEELSGCSAFSGREVEVMNFGVRGYSTAQELLTMREKVFQYHPDLVLLAFYTENDIVENSPALNTKIDYTPYFKLDGGELVPDFSFRNRKLLGINRGKVLNLYFNARAYSRLMQVLDIDRAYRGYRDTLRAKRKNKPADDYEGMVVFKESYTPPDRDEVRDAWSVTEAMISEIDREASAHGASLLVATLSSPIQVYPDSEYRNAFAKSIGTENLFYGDRRIRKFCQDAGIDVITLAPVMQQAADTTGVLYHGFENTPPGTGHWNELGHRTGGRMMANHLCSPGKYDTEQQ